MEKKYIDIAKKIRDRIEAGIYKPGEYLPGRLELASEFNVARATIDKCIDFLVSTGIIISEQGSGTYVNNGINTAGYNIALICKRNLDFLVIRSNYGIARMEAVLFEDLKTKAGRLKLAKYDGLIWDRPEGDEIKWIYELKDTVSQVILNRVVDDFYCISADHKGAYRKITKERLELCPDASVYFLNSPEYGLVGSYREAGFIEACKEKSKDYKIITVPEDFYKRVDVLNENIDTGKNKKILLISASWFCTGSVILWAIKKKLKWQKDIYYSDFDNESPAFVWGLKVTSYLQRHSEMLRGATKTLVNLVAGRDAGIKHKLIFPERVYGDT